MTPTTVLRTFTASPAHDHVRLQENGGFGKGCWRGPDSRNNGSGLNNEAIAEIVATALSVVAKKLMEAFTYEVLSNFVNDKKIDAQFKTDVFKAIRAILDPTADGLP